MGSLESQTRRDRCASNRRSAEKQFHNSILHNTLDLWAKMLKRLFCFGGGSQADERDGDWTVSRSTMLQTQVSAVGYCLNNYCEAIHRGPVHGTDKIPALTVAN